MHYGCFILVGVIQVSHLIVQSISCHALAYAINNLLSFVILPPIAQYSFFGASWFSFLPLMRFYLRSPDWMISSFLRATVKARMQEHGTECGAEVVCEVWQK